jgi:hypothetical protein
MNRREFLKLTGVGVTAAFVSPLVLSVISPAEDVCTQKISATEILERRREFLSELQRHMEDTMLYGSSTFFIDRNGKPRALGPTLKFTELDKRYGAPVGREVTLCLDASNCTKIREDQAEFMMDWCEG